MPDAIAAITGISPSCANHAGVTLKGRGIRRSAPKVLDALIPPKRSVDGTEP